jgi:hypothetical protein
MRRRVAAVLSVSLFIGLLAATPAWPLETDQYEAWGHELKDSTAALNAKITYEMQQVLDRVNRRRGLRRLSCETVTDHVAAHFRMLIFHPIEIWASKSPLVDRYPPDDAGELASRKTNILGNRGFWDIGGWLPSSPTIVVGGVRVGADKWAHFFSGGGSYYRFFKRALEQGLSEAEAELLVIDRGIFSEETYLGYGSSGVLSPADLEANYRGMTFLLGLCEGDAPQLRQDGDRFELARPFDAGEFVTVEWDESYNNSGFVKRRWKKVKPRMLELCPKLEDPWVQAQRARYAKRDVETPTEVRLHELIEAGDLSDVGLYSLDALCDGRSP